MKNKLDFIINEKNLKSLNACQKGIDFAKKYFNNLNFKDLEVEGDFKDYFFWLKKELKNGEKIYDKKGNLKSYKDSNGFEQFYFYDKKGNLKSKKTSNGYEEFYFYDKKGNLKSWKDSDGYEEFYFYDKKGNLKNKKTSDGYEEFYDYKFDEKNRLIEIFIDKKSVCKIKYKD